MLLTVDVGNTHVVAGVFDRNKLIAHWRLGTDQERTEDEYAAILGQLLSMQGIEVRQLTALAIASVVPPLRDVLETWARRYLQLEPFFLLPGVRTGMPVKYENPREVGADRIANAVAAYEFYGGPAIVVDFGTATTYCAISAAGEYLGGAIAPGIGTATEALFRRAAKLPRIDLVSPPSVIGRNTVSSMQAGIVFGFAGQVDAVVARMARELDSQPVVVATGGWASLIARETAVIERVEPFLTLQGLRIIYLRNHPEDE